jgi:PAX-interacting protein 1
MATNQNPPSGDENRLILEVNKFNEISTEDLRKYIILLSEILEKRIENSAANKQTPNTVYSQRRPSSQLIDTSLSSRPLLKPPTLKQPTPSSPPEAKRLKSSNRFAVLSDDEETIKENMEIEDEDISQTPLYIPKQTATPQQTQRQTPPENHSSIKTNNVSTNPATQRIPPIVIRDKTKWKHLSNILKTEKITILKAKDISIGISIYPATADDFRKTIKIVVNENIWHHTYVLPEDKKLHVVLRGVPEPASTDEIKQELELKGFSPINVYRLTRFKDKTPLPLVTVTLPKEEKHIFQLDSLMYLRITVETYRQRPGMSQCHRCQLFGHSQSHCTAPPRCVKCAGTHLTNTCTKLPTMPPTCANCGKDHPASYKGCEKWPKLPTKGVPAKLVQPNRTYSNTLTGNTTTPKEETLATIFEKFQTMYNNMQVLAKQLNNLFGTASQTIQK